MSNTDKRTKNDINLVTIVIYVLTAYIVMRFCLLSFGNIISDKMITNLIKNKIFDELPQTGYLISIDKKVVGEENILGNLIRFPNAEYIEEKSVSGFVKEGETIFCLDNEVNKGNLENTNEELKDIDDNKDINKANSIVDDKYNEGNNDNEGNNNIGHDSDNVATNNIENNESGVIDSSDVNANNTVSENQNSNSIKNQQYTKIREFEPNELTYDFLMKNFYTVVSATTLYPEDIDSSVLMNMDMKMQTTSDKPQILIYHTHGQEGFVDSVEGDPSTRIIGVGDYLAKLLTEKYGYNVIHITDSFDYVNGVFDRSKAYDYACERISQVLADNPSIEVVLDLHRDGVSEDLHLATEINGKPTAKIMFFNGISRLNSVGEIGYLYNPNRQENLAMSMQMKVLSEEYFEDFTRKNYIQGYQYNLHLRGKSMLIEAGAQTNTLEEELNAMEPLAFLLNQLLSGSK